MRRRPSARLLVLDAADRVLLFRFVHTDGALAGQDYWATPGGALEPGETFEQAAIRELCEETGIVIGHLAPSIATREFTLQMDDGEHVWADERYFIVHVDKADLSRDGWSALEHAVMAEHKWWSDAELLATKAVVWPENLRDMLKDCRA